MVTKEQQKERREIILEAIKEIGAFDDQENCYLISITALSDKLGISRQTISSDLNYLNDSKKIELFERKIVFGVRVKC